MKVRRRRLVMANAALVVLIRLLHMQPRDGTIHQFRDRALKVVWDTVTKAFQRAQRRWCDDEQDRCALVGAKVFRKPGGKRGLAEAVVVTEVRKGSDGTLFFTMQAVGSAEITHMFVVSSGVCCVVLAACCRVYPS